MEKITRNNYEAFMLDYLEGNLSDDQEQQMMDFLKVHPDLEQDMRELEQLYLVPPEATYSGKQQLKKSLTLPDEGYTHFDELCLSRLEGEMTTAQSATFDELTGKDTRKRSIYRLYEITKLQPDTSVVFADKEDLKKETAVVMIRPSTRRYLAMAASVLLLMGLHLFLPRPGEFTQPDIQAYRLPVKPAEIPAASVETPPVAPKAIAVHTPIHYQQLSAPLTRQATPATEAPTPPDRQAALASLQPLQPRKGIEMPREPIYARLDMPVLPLEEMRKGRNQRNAFGPYQKVDRFLERQNYALKNTIQNQKFSLWDVAELGIEGISKLTGKDLTLERRYNQDGELQHLAFKTESFRLSTNLKE